MNLFLSRPSLSVTNPNVPSGRVWRDKQRFTVTRIKPNFLSFDWKDKHDCFELYHDSAMVSHTENLNSSITGGKIIEEPRTTLPLDILLHIIDLLAGGDHEDIGSLHILSQTCKYLVSPCHKHLFSKFSSLTVLRGCNLGRFSDLLLKNPWIARYVRSLTYILSPPFSNHDLNVIYILKKHSSESFDSITIVTRKNEIEQSPSIDSIAPGVPNTASHSHLPRHRHHRVYGNGALRL